MKRSRILTVLVGVCLLMGIATTAFATGGATGYAIEGCYLSPNAVRSNYSVGAPVDESLSPLSRAATVLVYVTSPCDAEFRAKYPSSWAYQANAAVERADDGLYDLYGIDYLSVSQQSWSSSGSTMSALLTNAKTSCGLTYNGNLTADLMIAFTGKTTTDRYIGLANVSAPYALIKDGGYDQNAACVQHETGHTYGCSHADKKWDTDTECIMYKYLTLENIDTFCADHDAVMQSHKNDY